MLPKVKSFRFELFLSLSLSRSPRNYAPSFGSTFSNLFISGRKENSIARIIGLGSSIRSARRHCCAFHVKSFRGFLILAYRLSSLSLFHPNPCSRSLIYAPFLKSSGTARESDIYIPPLIFPRFFPCFRANVISPLVRQDVLIPESRPIRFIDYRLTNAFRKCHDNGPSATGNFIWERKG